MSQEDKTSLTEENVSKNRWTSSLGFIMAMAGAAVGMGNLCRFPTMVGQNGGGAFVLVYLACVVIIGIPMLMAEISIGRHGRGDTFVSYRKVSRRWGGLGLFAILISLVGLSYYTVMGGWILRYIVLSFQGIEQGTSSFFQEFTGSASQQLFFYLFYMAITVVIVIKGIAKGIERACKIMLPILFVFLVILAVRSCTLPGAGEGVSFFLSPDFSKITPQVFLMALGQVFFSLSVGAGAGITYGAYLPEKASIPKNAIAIAGFDTLAAMLAGLAILPALFAFNQTPTFGPGLLFEALPAVFGSMPGGNFFAVVFFLLVLFASVTTTIAFLEVVVSFAVQTLHITRGKATLICAFCATVLGIPCALSFGLLEPFHLFGMTLFELVDYAISNLFLPVSAIFTCIFLGWIWKSSRAVKEVTNQGSLRFPVAKLWAFWVKFVLPVLIFGIFLTSLGIM